MGLPIQPPFAPMEALSVESIPEGREWQYEPKWDGFRCLAFRDGDDVDLQSKASRPLGRYFPEIVEAIRSLKAKQFILDGELVIVTGDKLSFDDLLLRLHPAESRVRKLAADAPATFIAFDLLANERGKSLAAKTLVERRPALESFAAKYFDGHRLRLSPAAHDIAEARRWLQTGGGTLDGVIAKRTDIPYASGNRDGMQKIKLLRTADCVVGGFRYAERKKVVGSLLLGLFDEKGLLHHVGFCSGIKTAEREALTKKLEKVAGPPGFTGRAPGGPSRWTNKRSTEWQPLKTSLVCEVEFDHVSGERFRHGTRFLRWRPDKDPRQCTMDQMKQKKSRALELLQ
jgi:ATP-dependent DNA ligase